jgi:hypothetical protein
MEYFSNPPAPCPAERLPKPKETQPAEQGKRKAEKNDDKGSLSMFLLEEIDRDFYRLVGTVKRERQ